MADALPDTLDTARLQLRQADEADAAMHRRLWQEREPRVPSHRRLSATGCPSEADIAEGIRDGRQPDLYTVVVTATGRSIGYCGLVSSEHGTELAFELLRAHQGRGYATEAAEAVIAAARGRGDDLLDASVWDWNIASLRVLAKLGFRDTGAFGPLSAHGRTLILALSL